LNILSYLVIFFLILIKSIELKQNVTTSSSSSVPDPLVYLDVDHEETLDVPFNDIGSSTTGRRSRVSSAMDSYSGKLIAE